MAAVNHAATFANASPARELPGSAASETAAKRWAVPGATASEGAGNGSADKPAFVKSEYWLNVGYTTSVIVQRGDDIVEVEKFISMARGIPLDVVKSSNPKPLSHDPETQMLMQAKELLTEKMLAKAQTLVPGQAMIFSGDIGGLQLELRRALGDATPVTADVNQYVKKLAFED